MFEQRLQQRLRAALAAPAILILLIAGFAALTADNQQFVLREQVFDLFKRIEPRAAIEAEAEPVVINIGAESVERLGDWPWPRTLLANLVTAVRDADAAGVVITLPLEGADPLSPENVVRFWRGADTNGEAIRALRQLSTTNAALAYAAGTFPTAFGAGSLDGEMPGWERADSQQSDWMTLETPAGSGFIALRAAPIYRDIDQGLRETGLVAVTTLPQDADGIVRRAPLLWSLNGAPVPSAALAAHVVTGTDVHAVPSAHRLHAGGPPPASIRLGDRQFGLDSSAGIGLWLPSDPEIQPVPAWRVLEGGRSWTRGLAGRVVFIGQTVAPGGTVMTPRGEIPAATVHAQLYEQLVLGAVPQRLRFAGPIEALAAILFGVGAVLACLFLRPALAAAVVTGLTVLSFLGAFLLFRQSGAFVDPLPAAAAAIGSPVAILLVTIADMLVRNDALRGAFHGALPPGTMAKLQGRNASLLLHGVRREVTVLSCGLRLPASVVSRFEGRPDDFMRFTAAANDALRRTILAHGGTVDFGEDGRLLGYWNVPEPIPDPVEKACACALRMIDDLNSLSEDVRTAAFAGELADGGVDAGFAEGSIEIGLASSICFAGPVGRGSRNRYAVIGEAVKLASALRQRSRRYGPAIITDDVVYDALRHHYAFLDLDAVRIDTDGPLRSVYGLVGNPFLKASKAFRQLSDVQRELVASWRRGDAKAATLQLQRLRGIPGVPDTYVSLFEERLMRARHAPDDAQPLAEHLPL
jgi:adenylate cyclase